MEHQGDQTKIHFNPDFISRGGTLPNRKVHVNPAFLQKTQEVQQIQKFVTPAASSAGSTGHVLHWQAQSSGAVRHAPQMSANLLHTQNRNTATNVYSYSSKSIHDHTVPSSQSRSHSSVYKKTNPYNSYDKSYSRYKDLPYTQSIASTNTSAVTTHPSTYSWKATSTSAWSSCQGNSLTLAKGQGNANLIKDSAFVTQHYTYQNPASKYSSVNKSLVRTRVVKRITDSHVQIQPEKDKPSASHSSLHSLSHATHNLQSSGIKSEATPSRIVVQRASQKGIEKTSPNLLVGEVKSGTKPSDTLTKDTGSTFKNDFHKVPKRQSSNFSNAQALVSDSLPTARPVQLTPNQKWVTKNKVVNSSPKNAIQPKVEVKTSSPKITFKTPKQKGNYKIITKTKLVRTHSNIAVKGKVQQQAVAGQSSPQTSKTIMYTSPRVTSISRVQKVSPLFRIHQTAARSSKKKYSVLSRTKLVRRQSLSGKAGTPGKPKYSVNTKNKLVRRRSSSGPGGSKSSSKTVESKTKTSKSETEKQRKFHVLSKTKIIRRSSSGAYKSASTLGSAVASPGQSKKRSIVKRHKLVRNASSASLRHEAMKVNKSFPKKVNTAFKVINAAPKLSPKQRIAKGIVSKYKINRLKLESYDTNRKYQKSFDHYKVNRLKLHNESKKYKKFNNYSSKARQKSKFKNKKVCASEHSDRFINIGGILYKSTKTSLRKQVPKITKTSVKKSDSTCTVLLRGEKFHLTAGGKTLRRVKDSTPSRSSLSRVHLGGLTYSRTRTGLYELTKTHQARAILSSARQRSMVTLIQKRKKASFQKRNEYCVFFNRFGRCSKKKRGECPYIHDPSRVAICTRFLRGRCPVNNCPFSHTVNPDKMPVCSHFLQAACTREGCPYRHVRVNPAAPVCLNFVKGYCKAGEECDKQHILVCEEFKAGKCPRGASCPLSHHKGRGRPRRVSASRYTTRRLSTSTNRKRKRSECREVLGGPATKKRVEKKKQEPKPSSSRQRYFDVMVAEESKEGTENVLGNSEHSGVPEQKVPHENTSKTSASDNLAEAEATGDEIDKEKITCDNYNTNPTSKSAFEETRSRVMRKIDKIKKAYSGVISEGPTENAGNSATNSDIGDCKDERKTNTQEVVAENLTETCSDAKDTDSDALRVQRPQLLKRLPSYIPLDSE